MKPDWEHFFDGYKQVRTARCVEDSLHFAKKAEQCILGFRTASEEGRKQRASTAPDANIFSVLGVEHLEATHSRFLAWLLDCTESHEQGALFFRHLGKHLGLCDGFVAQASQHCDYQVVQELSGRESRIDIAIHHKRFLLFIENKVNAVEGYKQTQREFCDLLRLVDKSSGQLPFAVFLSPSGTPPSDQENDWTALSYQKVHEQLLAALHEVRSGKVRSLVQQYLRSIAGFM